MRVVPKKSTPGKMAYIWHFQRIGISAKKFEKTRIHVKSDIFAAVAVADATARERDVCESLSFFGCSVNAMTKVISGVVIEEWIRIGSPGKTSAFVDSLQHLYTFNSEFTEFISISALWDRHVKYHRCSLHRMRVRLFSAGGYCK